MILTDSRKWKKPTYTIGQLFIDGVLFCNTLEDTDRELKQTDSITTINSKKVPGETAIPTGKYEVTLDVVSPKYSASNFYKQVCDGKVPRLLNVPGFEGILIHTGNTALDSYGCILVGKNTIKGQVTDSRNTFKALYKQLSLAKEKGEKIYIEIV